MARLAIIGSRHYRRLELIHRFVSRLKPTTEVISGGASGVDAAVQLAANHRHLALDVIPADWDLWGRSAGCRRNETIVQRADGVVAFWDGQSRGTAHVISLARRKGIWMRVYGPDGELLQSQEAF